MKNNGNYLGFSPTRDGILNVTIGKIKREFLTLEGLLKDVVTHAQGLRFNVRTKDDKEHNATTIANYINDQFGGDFLTEVFRAIYLQTNVVADGLIRVHETFNKQLSLPVFDSDFIAVNADALFTGSGSQVSANMIILNPVEYSVMEQVNWKATSESFFSTLQGYGVYAGFLPPEILLLCYMLDYSDFQRNLTNRIAFAGSARTPKYAVTTPIVGIEQQLSSATNLPYLANTPSIAFSAAALSPDTYNGEATWTRLTVANNADLNVGDYITPIAVLGVAGTNLNNAIYNVGNDRTALNNIGLRKSSANQIQILAKPTATTIDISVRFAPATTFNNVTTSGRIAFINKSNAKQTVINAWNSVPFELRDNPDFRLMMHPRVFQAIRQIDADTFGARLLISDEDVRAFLGMPVYQNPFQSPNVIIGAIGKDNFHIGMFLEEEGKTLQVRNLADSELSYLFNFRADLSMDVKVLKTNECIYVRPN